MQRILVLILLVLVLFSCKKENEKSRWDVDVVTPLFNTTMTIRDIVNDTVMQVNTDSSVSLVYQNKFYDFNLDTIFKIPDTTIEFTAKLSELKLDDIIVGDGVSLGQIAMKDKEDNGASSSLYLAIINGLNNGLPTDIPAMPTQQFSDITLDATEYFESLTVSEAYIDITIDNKLPIPINNLVFEIKNQISQDVIVTDTFFIINSNTIETKQKMLTNTQLEGILEGNISLQSPGAAGVIINDTSRTITATINIHDIKISEAYAKFPDQNIIEINDALRLDIDGTQINEILVRDGNILIQVFNTLPEEIEFEYKMPNVKKDNSSFTFNGVIPASGNQTYNIDLSDYNMNMRGNNNDTVNKIDYILSANINSSGQLVHLSLNDSIYLKSSFSEIVPQYAQGWFGNEIIHQSGETNFDIMPELSEAEINFDDVKLNISIENQVGIKAGIQFNEIKAINTNTANNSQLTIPSNYLPFIINKPIDVGNSNIIPSISEMSLNSNNSNPSDLINILPNKILYNLDFSTNYGEQEPEVGTGTDFIYYGTTVNANLNIELPLSFIASNLALTDTVELDIKEEINEIESGKFYLFVYNGFPLEADIQLYLLDEELQITDSLFIETNTVNAGVVDNTINKVITSTRTQLSIPLSKTKFFDVLNTKKILIKTKFTTKPDNQHVKIYSNYKIKFKMTGDFTYYINKQ